MVDAGSSGTRFCLWSVVPAQGRQGSCTLPERVSACVRTSDGRGLQAMTLDEVSALFASSLGHLQERTAIARAVVLGTGGFRDEQGRIDRSPPDFNARWDTVREAFSRVGVPVVARPIEGEEEGRLGWIAVSHRFRPAGAFSTIETGGATCQFASASAPQASFAAVRAVSDVVGQNHTWKVLSSRPDFAVCSSGLASSAAGQDADACASLIEREVFAPSRLLASLTAEERARPLYALGTPWNYIFTRYLPHDTSRPWALSVTLAQLRAVARKYCTLSALQISHEASTYVPEHTCYTLAYHVAFLRAVGGPDEEHNVALNGEESWDRGAAVTGHTEHPDATDPSQRESLFPDCD